MSLRNILKAVDIAAVATGIVALVAWSDKNVSPALFCFSLALLLSSGMDAFVASRRLSLGGKRRRLSAFRSNECYQAGDLESVFADGGVDPELSLPVQLSGRMEGGTMGKAPLSGRVSLGWTVEALLLGGIPLVPGDAEALTLDSWWGGGELSDSTGRMAVDGPGILDASAVDERFFLYSDLKKRHPGMAASLSERMDLSAKEWAKARFLLREVSLSPREEVMVYGQASKDGNDVRLSGSSEPGDPSGLLIRAVRKPSSSRVSKVRARSAATMAVGLLSAAASLFFLRGMALADVRSGPVDVDADGRAWDIGIGDGDWSFDEGDTRLAVELQSDGVAVDQSADAKLAVKLLEGKDVDLKPGEPGYPRWDGTGWILSLGGTANAQPLSAGGTGKLVFRNLTDGKVTVRAIDATEPSFQGISWSYAAREWADSAEGGWPVDARNRPYQGSAADRIELVTASGYRRIARIGDIGAWKDGAWHIDLVPESLAGSGSLFFSNASEKPVQLWILDERGNYLHGKNPWSFDPHEGTGANRGLSLQVDDTDISFSGRETVRYRLVEPRAIFQGKLRDAAAWKKDHWQLTLSALGQRE